MFGHQTRWIGVLFMVVGLLGLSACPNNTPGDPVLSKIIIGEWEVGGSPAHFNRDGTFEIEYYSLAGT